MRNVLEEAVLQDPASEVPRTVRLLGRDTPERDLKPLFLLVIEVEPGLTVHLDADAVARILSSRTMKG